MPLDPLSGRVKVPTNTAPYRNALTVTPDDTRDLPVIPTAIYFPPTVPAIWTDQDIDQYGGGSPATDANGILLDVAEGEPVEVLNEYPWRWGGAIEPARIAMIALNGQTVTFTAPSAFDRMAQPTLMLPLRPRRILRTGTTLQRITLLW